jgi:ABC-type transport system substrate-binding protein
MPPPAIASPSIVTLYEHVSMGLIEWWRWNPDGTFLQRSILHYGTAPARRASAEHATFGHGDAAVLRPFSPCPRPADLVIGRAGEHFSADPQFAESGNNINTATDMFDSLVASDANQPVPALAVSWQAVDPLTWQIKLRPNVTFGDGSPQPRTWCSR